MASLTTTARELRDIVAQYYEKFNLIGDSEFSAKPLPSKWSKKEVVGHLCDSAQNNLRRFITGQYESSPPHIVYDQDFWVSVSGYQNMEKKDVVDLWRLLNDRIAAVIEKMPAESYQRTCNTGKGTASLRALDWLANDYVDHLKHHVNQVVADAFPGHKYPKV